MKLMPSIFVSALIVAVFWAIAVFQPRPAEALPMSQTEALSLEEDTLRHETTSAPSISSSPSVPRERYSVQNLPVVRANTSVKRQTDTHQKNRDVVRHTAVNIVGVTANVDLDEVPLLWGRFNDNESLNGKLMRQPDRVYVYYRDFSADYDRATVSIGYDESVFSGSLFSDQQNTKAQRVMLPETAYETVLRKQSYTDKQLADVWQTLDYRRVPKRMLEVHHLDADSQVIATRVLVSYKEH